MNRKLLIALIMLTVLFAGCISVIHVSTRSDPQTLDTSVGGRLNKFYDWEKVSGLDIPDDIEFKVSRVRFHSHVAVSVEDTIYLDSSTIYVFISKTDTTDVPMDTTLPTPPVNPSFDLNNHRLLVTIDFDPIAPGDSANFTVDAEVSLADINWVDDVIQSRQDFYIKAILIPRVIDYSYDSDVTAYLDDTWLLLDFEKETGGLFPLLNLF
jgi:hypothetical protein